MTTNTCSAHWQIVHCQDLPGFLFPKLVGTHLCPALHQTPAHKPRPASAVGCTPYDTHSRQPDNTHPVVHQPNLRHWFAQVETTRHPCSDVPILTHDTGQSRTTPIVQTISFQPPPASWKQILNDPDRQTLKRLVKSNREKTTVELTAMFKSEIKNISTSLPHITEANRIKRLLFEVVEVVVVVA